MDARLLLLLLVDEDALDAIEDARLVDVAPAAPRLAVGVGVASSADFSYLLLNGVAAREEVDGKLALLATTAAAETEEGAGDCCRRCCCC